MTNHSILLVEDNPDDADLALLAFKESGIQEQTLVARDGQEALDYLLHGGSIAGCNAEHLPKVVLLDLNLPRVDGFEVLKRLRGDALTHCLPVVILSSSREEIDLARAYRLGANSYIQKSLDFSHFVQSVKQMGEYWLSLNVVPEACQN
ncbi:MAG: response regulator [Sulfuricella sp.]|nr:response regulator [Sulfuricella sp.]